MDNNEETVQQEEQAVEQEEETVQQEEQAVEQEGDAVEEEEEVMEYEDLVRHINKSSYRVNVLKDLSDGDVKMPTELARNCNILPNHISNVLTHLRKLELLECINPEYKKGRLYRLTDDGKEILKDLK